MRHVIEVETDESLRLVVEEDAPLSGLVSVVEEEFDGHEWTPAPSRLAFTQFQARALGAALLAASLPVEARAACVDVPQFIAELVELLGLDPPHDTPKGIVEEVKVYQRLLVEEVSKVYCEVTGGRISKPNTYATEVIREFNEQIDRERAEAITEAKAETEALQAELDEEREKRADLEEAAAGAEETRAELERLRSLERELKDACSGVNCVTSFEWKERAERRPRAILRGVMASLDSFVPFSAGRIIEEAKKYAPDLSTNDVHPPLQDVANAIFELRERATKAESAKESAEFRFGEALKSRDRTKDRHDELVTKLAALTDKWLCRAADPVIPEEEARHIATVVAEVRELLPEGTRYDNG